MFFPFKRQKKEGKNFQLTDFSSFEANLYNPIKTFSPIMPHQNSQMTRLMELIGEAIEKWEEEYHLENLPKSIVFQQVLDAMRAIEQTYFSKD